MRKATMGAVRYVVGLRICPVTLDQANEFVKHIIATMGLP